MDCALRDPATAPLEYNTREFNTGLSVTLEDLERLFRVMTEAAARFRLYDGPAPEHWADTWKRAVSRCATVCRKASTEYLSLCIDKDKTVGGEIRVRPDAWNYMTNLFDTWPARDGTIRTEPPLVTEAVGIHPVDTSVAPLPPKKTVKVQVNKEKLAKCFNEEFKATRQGEHSKFDLLYYAMTTATFNKTDWGRIAYAIKWNHAIVANRVRFMSFTPWLEEFFDIIGVDKEERPKDTRQNKYKDQAGAESFIKMWLRLR